MSAESAIAPFRRLLGQWTTVATHPEMPGITVRGTMEAEWLEGERFLLVRARTDHPQFPDSLVVIGDMTQDRAASVPGRHHSRCTTSTPGECSGISRRG